MKREKIILSVAQFRPEKNHSLQIQAFAKFIREPGMEEVKLILVGGCRNSADAKLIEKLKSEASELGLRDKVQWRVNCAYGELRALMARSTAGLHSMWNEHFGISVVELPLAGVVPVAHNSGGPKMDILRDTDNGELVGEFIIFALNLKDI